MNHLKNKIKVLEKVIHELTPYVGHAKYCKYVGGGVSVAGSDPDTDFCTCNLAKVVKHVQKALEIKV
jgi:hypothetical protein